MLTFRILGPLSVTDAGREVAITAGRDRVVLAMLLLRPGRIVGVDELIDAVWEDRPPTTARGQLQTCVSRLRRTLPPGLILTDPAGYGIRTGAAALDAAEFTRLVSAAATSGADDARKLLREALELWRGPVLAGIDSRAVRQQAAVLDEQQATVLEDRIELDLAGGHDRDLVAELTGLVERFPLRERLRRQLMLTLYRVGRQADALAEYRRAEELFREELGIEPGEALRDLHHRILTGSVAEDPPPAAPPAPVDSVPRAVGDFTGRGDLVNRLVGAIRTAGPAETQVRVLDGMAGSGKTTIAIHVAGLVRDRYPDARLFIDLHGHSASRPVEPAAALVTLLRQLGVAADRIPDDLDERIRLWRAELAQRRALVVLDNAASTTQVTPLLPTAGGVLALVTSRRRLVGLDAVRPESLSVLPEPDAIALLARIAGDRVGAEPAAAAEVVRRCGCLPLAIRLAGARLAHRPRWRVADLVRRLGESALPELAAEDRTVASAFAVTYGQLPERAQRVFRLLGLHPAERFGVLSVAALGGLSRHDAQDVLDELVDVHLAEESEPDRFRLHDLVRQYAATLAEHIAPAERRTALNGLVDLHLHAAATISWAGEIDNARHDYPVAAPDRPELVALAAADPQWLEHQRPDLVGLVSAAARAGSVERAWQLARVNWRYLYERSYTDDLIAVLSRARALAEAGGDARGIAATSNYLASGYYRSGRHEEALRIIDAAVTRSQQIGDFLGESRSRANRVGVLMRLGRIEEALTDATWAYVSGTRISDPQGQSSRLNNLAIITAALGRTGHALLLARRALQPAVEVKDDRRLCNALVTVAQIRNKRGDTGQAERLLRAALRLAVRIGYRVGEWESRNELGRVALAQGRYAESVAQHMKAVELSRERGADPAIAVASNDLAAALLATGDRAGARQLRLHALALARRTVVPYEQARSLAGLAECVVGDDPAAARRHWQQALDLFERMGVPERFAVRRRLAGLDSGPEQLRTPAGGGRMEA
ncbi:AfsR/SARP family transcriptional regulator [Actinoplanes nipponensis]|uniref:SARP family transcriptional regulator n=1 Tax=Actinoplanes nipponensis TaxID=135950 RepID=A0A919MH67_9ACTN|nr:BTAD domain-containing putative transcriptional regulator [Actinoplanes nipponensis]GIE49354.1 SARP family transcriptional regulator [Actinoplanes nipponensis]